MPLAIPSPPQFLPSSKNFSGGTIPAHSLSLTTKLSHLSVTCPTSVPFKTTPVCMGCPRISPGGVTKMKWRTMQAKKAKQLQKAGLARERQIYKMRKRAELRAAVVELERPWESDEKPTNLLPVSGDEQLEDWFQNPGWFDLLSDRDGRVGHSVYGKMGKMSTTSEEFESPCLTEDARPESMKTSVGKSGVQRKGRCKNSRSSWSPPDGKGSVEGAAKNVESENFMRKVRKQRIRKT